MRRWLYDLGFLTFGLVALPHFLKKIDAAEDRRRLVRERLGFLDPPSRFRWQGGHPLWIHCVSVGEVLAVEKLFHLRHKHVTPT